jgi:hypothetical protein
MNPGSKSTPQVQTHDMDFYEMPPGNEAPEIVNVIVEIPKGTRNKIEYDPTDRVFRLDRVLYSPVYYPGDYGFIPGTLSKDGDALDVLVLVTDPTFTGCVLQARPIGVLEMRDEKGFDEKILTVPRGLQGPGGEGDRAARLASEERRARLDPAGDRPLQGPSVHLASPAGGPALPRRRCPRLDAGLTRG